MAEWKIELPEKTVSRKKLSYKMKEYDQRLAKIAGAYPYPYFLPEDIADTLDGYKFAILHRVLRRGKIDVYRVFDELSEINGALDVERFFAAARVIEDYCKTDGENVRWGTGLKVS
jgi:hypothetical protein